MLSIIVSSCNLDNFTSLENSISKTVGIQYEICRIENFGLMGICEAYNKGAAEAIYDYLLFIHEDIIFHTENWGVLLCNDLNNSKIGAVGVAGSSYVPYCPIGYTNPVVDYNFHYILQHNSEGTKMYQKLPKSKISILALDGVFLGVRKEVFNEFMFDELIPGFHGYDLDFSLRVSTRYQNKITTNILIEHLSQGKPNITYLLNNIYVKNKTIIENQVNDRNNEYSSYRVFVDEMERFHFGLLDIVRHSNHFRIYS
ncbi:MAG: glycosyltransferase, partial [Chitinophagales bacterium]